MTYSYYREGGPMRAFALLLASALIVALVWFVSYKNGCVSCSDSDVSGSDKGIMSCQGCPSPKEVADAKKQAAEATSDSEAGTQEPGSQAADENDNRKVSFEVVIDGRSTRFEVDLDNLEDHKINVTSEDGVSAVFEKGTFTDVKVVVDTEGPNTGSRDNTQPSVQPSDEQPPQEPQQPADEQPGEDAQPTGNEGAENAEPVSDDNNGSDAASPEGTEPEGSFYYDEPVVEPQNTLDPYKADLPPVTLLDGADFGMEGRVLALGKGSVRRDGIVAVIPEEGKTVALLCETRTTQKTINEVKEQYPGKIIYTYTIDREFFVNLRGNSRFALHNCGDTVDIQPGVEKPEWLTCETSVISDDMVSACVAKNDLERYHVKGTKGCLVICESNDVFRYNWDKHGNYHN